MGNGSGPFHINSRVYTNSFAGKSLAMAFPYRNKGTSFGGLTKEQYSYLIYNSLAYHGAGAGGRAGKWNNTNGVTIVFNPPTSK